MDNILDIQPVIERQLETYITGVCGFPLLHRGKVRDLYKISNHCLLAVMTDRVSIYSSNLSDSIPGKGEILTAFTHFWTHLISHQFPEFLTDFIGSSDMIHSGLNAVFDLHQEFSGIPIDRCMVVRNLSDKLDPFDLVFRNHIGGSVYSDYQNTGMVSGQKIFPNLPEWSYLPDPLFSPVTKKEHGGHDKEITIHAYHTEMGFQSNIFIHFLKKIYQWMYEYCKARGIILLDLKLEASSSQCMVASEIGTPDSARYVKLNNWQRAVRGKEELRFFGKQSETFLSDSYNLFERLTGISMKTYQKKYMGMSSIHG